jgi:hypothetical protein
MLKRYFYVKLYPILYLSFKPLIAFFSIALLLLVFGVYFGFFRAPFLSSSAEEAVPANSSFIIKVKNPSEFNSNLLAVPYLDNLNSIDAFKVWQNEFNTLESFIQKANFSKKNAYALLSCLSLNGNDFVWTHIIPISGFNIKDFAKANNLTLTNRSNFLKSELYEYRHPSQGNWVFAYSRGLLIAGRQLSFIEASLASLNNTGNNLPFDRRFGRIENSNAKIALYANLELLPMFLSIFGSETSLSAEPVFKDLSWSGGELKLEKGNLVLGGKLTTKTGNFWNWLSGQYQKNEAGFAGLIPENFAYVRYLNLSNYKNSKLELNPDFKKYVQPWLSNESIFMITEPSDNSFASDKFYILKSKDSLLSKKMINQFANDFGILEKLKIRNYTVLKLAANALINPIFDVNNDAAYYCISIKDYVIFAGSATVLETWIENYSSGNTILKKSEYNSICNQLKQPSAAIFVINNKSMLPFLKSFSNDKSDLIWAAKFQYFQQFGPTVIQLKSLGASSFSLTLSSAFNSKSIVKTETNLIWRCNLEADAAVSPGTVYNTEKKQTEIMIQDVDNRLYLISQSGEIIWKKPLDSKVMSDFRQVDFYSNGEFYYIFNTLQSIYILDKNGEELNKITLAAKASNGLNVIQNEKEIRFYVGCSNGKVYGYDKNGRPLSGWNPNSNCGSIAFPLQYYSSENTRLLIAMTKKGKLTFANREGKIVKTYYLEGNYPDGFFIDSLQNCIVACSDKGKIDIIGFDGKRTVVNPAKDMNQNVSFFFADVNADESSDFIRLSKNMLTIHSSSELKNPKEILRHKYNKNQGRIFPVKRSSDNKNLIGSYNSEDLELNLLDNDKRIFKGFPIKSNPFFLFTDLYNENGITLLSNNGKTISAMKIK